ncbi:hypothetical protein ACFOLB_05495, partial [Microbacterium aurantiacum]
SERVRVRDTPPSLPHPRAEVRRYALGGYHKLTYEEWRAAGFPDPLRRADMGFFRLAWDASGNIAFMCDISAGRGTVLSLSEWRAAGSPTPTSVSRTPNDSIWTDPAYPHIYYRGAINFTRLTLAQWQSLGSPTPTVDDLDYLRRCGESDWIPGGNDVY